MKPDKLSMARYKKDTKFSPILSQLTYDCPIRNSILGGIKLDKTHTTNA